ncbi:MAG: hypothetical protein H0V17_00590, partial [Deltaproteobacteria bacterium]|nr:hypothetical protein [Deltaproteobacteria bacterium]
MKGTLVVSLLLGLAGSAAAESQLDLPENPLETPWSSSLLRTKHWVADDVPRYNGDDVQHAAGFSNVVYLNNCKPNGCAIKVGNDNSLTNTSQIPNSNAT